MEPYIFIILGAFFSAVFSVFKIHHESKKKWWETAGSILGFFVVLIGLIFQYNAKTKQDENVKASNAKNDHLINTVEKQSGIIKDLNQLYHLKSRIQDTVNNTITGGDNVPLPIAEVIDVIDPKTAEVVNQLIRVSIYNVDERFPIQNFVMRIDYEKPKQIDLTKKIKEFYGSEIILTTNILTKPQKYKFICSLKWKGAHMQSLTFLIAIVIRSRKDYTAVICYSGHHDDTSWTPAVYMESKNLSLPKFVKSGNILKGISFDYWAAPQYYPGLP